MCASQERQAAPQPDLQQPQRVALTLCCGLERAGEQQQRAQPQEQGTPALPRHRWRSVCVKSAFVRPTALRGALILLEGWFFAQKNRKIQQ